ncbi:MAG: hypothetical protein J0I06_16075, partial [Planctomycetes bacterium]|nr:hypothetical protein [Planctomycetota bacterium]
RVGWGRCRRPPASGETHDRTPLARRPARARAVPRRDRLRTRTEGSDGRPRGPAPPGARARLGTDRGAYAFGWGTNCALAPDGRVLLRQGNWTLRWIDPATGRDVGKNVSVGDNDGAGEPVAVAADGARAAFSWNDHARVYDLKTGKRLATIPAATKLDPRSAVISADGGVVAVGQGQRFGQPLEGGASAIVWDVAGNRELARVPVAEKGNARVALTPDGKTLLTRNGASPPFGQPAPADTRTTRVWDAGTGKALGKLEAEGPLYQFAFAADSAAGAAWNPDARAVEVFEPRTGKRVRALSDPALTGPGGLAFAPDGKTLLAVDFGTLAAVAWDVGTGRRVKLTERPADLPPRGVIRGATYTAAGKPLAWGVWDRNVALAWDPLAGTPLTPTFRHLAGLTGVAFTPDGKQVVTTDAAGVNLRWDAETGKPIGPVRVDPDAPGDPPPVLCPSSDAARGFSTRAAYDLYTGKRLSGYPSGLSFSHPSAGVRPDTGGRVALVSRAAGGAGAAGRCVLWDPATGKTALDVALPPARAGFGEEYAVALTPDGSTLAVGFDREPKAGAKESEASVTAWDVATGKAKWERTFPGGPVKLAAAPDGKTLAAVVRGRVEALDAGTGKTLGEFGADNLFLMSPVFTPDGTRCVVYALDNRPKTGQRIELEVRAWPSGEVRAVLPGRDAGTPAAISPDGKTLATRTGLTVLLWKLPDK